MKILGLNKSGYYYKPREPKPDEAEICAAIDREHLDLFFLFVVLPLFRPVYD